MATTASGNPKTGARKIIERIPMAWIFVPALLVSILFAFGDSSHGHFAVQAANTVIVLSVGGIVCHVFRWKAALIFDTAIIAVYWSAAFVAVEIGLLIFVQGGPFGLILLGGFVLLILLLTVPFAIAGSILVGVKAGPGWPLGAIVAALIVAAGIASTGMKAHQRPFRAFEPNTLAPDLVTIDKCLFQYKAAHSGTGFPESLQQLGHQGSGCLPEALLQGELKGYALSYQPGAKDADGKVTSFDVQATETPHGEDYAMATTDQSGLVFISYPGPTARGNKILAVSASFFIDTVVTCLKEVYPAPDVLDKQGAARFAARNCLNRKQGLSATDAKVTGYDYDGEYSFQFGEYLLKGFTLQVRPHEYGTRALRSYLVLATHAPCSFADQVIITNTHATPENRPATTSDPPASDLHVPGWCK